MKYENFDDFLKSVESTISPIKEKWEAENKVLTKKFNIFKVFLIIFDVILFALIFKYLDNIKTTEPLTQVVKVFFLLIGIIMIDAFLVLFYDILTFHKSREDTNKEYKEKIITKMLENFVDELEYDPKKGIDKGTFEESRYECFYDDYEAEDYFKGSINGNKVEMSDLLLTEQVEETDSDGSTTSRTRTLFRGIFGKIKLPKSINANVQIRNNGTFYMNGSKKLEMDSTNFECSFDVYTNNPIVAMQILTVSIEEDMAELQKNQKVTFDLNIVDDTMYFLFHTENMFEILKADKKSDEILKKYFEIMKFITKVIDKITNAIENTEI